MRSVSALPSSAVKALVFERSEARYAAALAASRIAPGKVAQFGPLRLSEIDPPSPPGDGWHVVHPSLSGICGSDLATLSGRTSRYFEPLVSFPFVPGHEVLGETDDGRRVVLDAVLGHAARGEPPPHAGAAPADGDDYGHLVSQPLGAGLQIGACKNTGGGWSLQMIAHGSSIHEVPDDLSDEAAVMIEPAASAIHAALRANPSEGDMVVVIGAGAIGLCAVAALRQGSEAETIIVAAKYSEQSRLAVEMGADIVTSPEELRRAVRRVLGCRMNGNVLSGGAHAAIDAVGSARSLTDAIAVTRPRGRVVICGMPGPVKVDLAPVWHREVSLLGAYTYGSEQMADGVTHTFNLAFELARTANLGQLVSAGYRLDDYQEAVRHAGEAGSRGSTKIVFDMRSERR